MSPREKKPSDPQERMDVPDRDLYWNFDEFEGLLPPLQPIEPEAPAASGDIQGENLHARITSTFPYTMQRQEIYPEKERIHFGLPFVPVQVIADPRYEEPSVISKERIFSGGSVRVSRLGKGENYAIVAASERKASDMFSDDQIAVLMQGENVGAFAVCDGVGSCLASRDVARLVAKKAVELNGELLDSWRAQAMTRERAETFVDTLGHACTDAFDKQGLIKDIEKHVHELLREDKDDMIKQVEQEKDLGSTTLITGFVRDQHLHVLQVGDGGFFVLRQGRVLMFGGGYDSRIPGQIGINISSQDAKKDLQTVAIPIQSGDKVFVFTDGLLKGPWKTVEALAQQAQAWIEEGASATEVVESFVEGAVVQAKSARVVKPYLRDDLSLLSFSL